MSMLHALAALMQKTPPTPATRAYLGAVGDSSGVNPTIRTMIHNGGVRTGRWVVGVGSRQSSGTPADPTEVTFCGVAMTKLVGQSATEQMSTSIWISTADITSDGTDPVVATFVGNQSATISFLYSVDNLISMDAGDTAGSQADPATLDIDTLSGGLAFAVSANTAFSAVTAAWTGLTEDYDDVFGYHFSAASVEIASGSTPLAVSVNYSTGTIFAACSVALR